MSTPQGTPVNGFSANSKNLKSFRLQQKLRSLLILIAIGIPVAGGIFAYQRYKTSTNPAVATATVIPDATTSNDADQAIAEGGAPTTPITTTPDTEAPIAMPDGVGVALNSIEQSGLKSNAYVAVDTNTIPAGSEVKADRATWTSFSPSLGSVSGTISYKGSVKKSSITFQLVNDTWKVTGYSIET